MPWNLACTRRSRKHHPSQPSGHKVILKNWQIAKGTKILLGGSEALISGPCRPFIRERGGGRRFRFRLNLPGRRSGWLDHHPVVVWSRALHSAAVMDYGPPSGVPTAEFLVAARCVRARAIVVMKSVQLHFTYVSLWELCWIYHPLNFLSGHAP